MVKGMELWRIAVDTGGTFTDCIGVDPSGEVHQVKVLSSGELRGRAEEAEGGAVLVQGLPDMPEAFWVGFRFQRGGTAYRIGGARIERQGVRLILDGGGMPEIRSGEVVVLSTGEEAPVVGIRLLTATGPREALPPIDLRLGTTRGTNALLERKGDPPLLIVTEGFGDLPRIRDQRRPDLFALKVALPEPLHGRVLELSTRLDADGEILEPLDRDHLWNLLTNDGDSPPRTAAVCILHSYRNDAVEGAIAEILEEAGVAYIASSAKLAPYIGYLSRMETALVDAYLGPLMEAYLDSVGKRLPEGGRFRVMTSAGGLLSRRHFRPKDSLLSGPAGGVAGVAAIGVRTQRSHLLALDMGGTSTDVSRYSGKRDLVESHEVGGARLSAPALRIETVAAGGGSICGFDGKLLTVGPESAGADPGPASYGRGGPLTLTDVNLLLGRFPEANIGIPMDRRAAETAFEAVRRQVEEGTGERANREDLLKGFLEIANERMSQAMQRISVREGYDPKEFSLVAFGGAGGQHACAIADRLGMREVLAPAEAGILSAYGIQQARLEVQEGKQVLEPWSAFSEGLEAEVDALEASGRAALRAEGWDGEDPLDIRAEVFLRFRGQDLEIPIEIDGKPVVERFRREFKGIFGYVPPDRELEVSRLRVRLSVCDGSLGGERFEAEGEAMEESIRVIADAFSALVVEPGWRVYRGSEGTLLLKRERPASAKRTLDGGDILSKTLATQRMRNLVEAMGSQLQRTALSTNVKERLDFSCALLDGKGRLVVNAPHIPVHLGAMGLCVREVSKEFSWKAGDIAVVNHPRYGGSHLPDITLITPVFEGDQLLGFLANRAHHAEIGGLLPGSMPPHAQTLEEEGTVIRPILLFENGESRWDDLRRIFEDGAYPSRRVEENLADLHAQVASLRKGKELFDGLLETVSKAAFSEHLEFLRKTAREEALGPLRMAVGDGLSGSDRLDDGSLLQVQMKPVEDGVCIDFSGTSPVHPGNLNATPAIVSSVLLYVFRLMVGSSGDLPLNEGFLDGVDLKVPEGLLNPRFSEDASRCPAVVGGNVEVSQRLANLLIHTLGMAAASQGTMNNVLFGNDRFSHYETIGGGSGAGPGWDGASGTHVHMSNTAITDPEILEFRFPVRLLKFSLRRGSGGFGSGCGGEGLVREYQALERMDFSLLTQNRSSGAAGARGGKPGMPGRQVRILKEGKVEPLEASAHFRAEAGDRLRVETPGGGGWGSDD